MAWPKKRPANSGRRKGTPNAERKDLFALLAEKFPGYNPVAAMAEIANDKKNDTNLRLQAHKEVAKYTFPQLKAIELSPGDGSKFKSFVIELTDEKNIE